MMRGITTRAGLLVLLVLLLAGCSKSCCPKEDCIDYYGLGDPDDCAEWAVENRCRWYPVPGPIVKIKSAGDAQNPQAVEYEVAQQTQSAGPATTGTLRDNFIGIRSGTFKCLDAGSWVDAQHVKIEYVGYRLEIKKTSLGTLMWSLSDATGTITLEPTGTFPAGTVPSQLLGQATRMWDINLGKDCAEVKLQVEMP